MDWQMQLYWETYNELITTEEFLKYDFRPIYQYEDQLVNGAIVDIGCGQTSALIRYAGLSDKRLIGIDNDETQLKKLRSRMIKVAGADSNKWELLCNDVQHGPLPDGKYSMVILYNILHFFSLHDNHAIIKKIKKHLISGSLISVSVHSEKFPMNDPANSDNNEYFKHYFSKSDLENLFPSNEFTMLYRADIERIYPKKDLEVAALWGEKTIHAMGITDNRTKNEIRQNVNDQKFSADFVCVYRKR